MDGYTFEVKVRQINRIIYDAQEWLENHDGNDDCIGIDLARAIMLLVKHRNILEIKQITNEINDINIKIPRR